MLFNADSPCSPGSSPTLTSFTSTWLAHSLRICIVYPFRLKVEGRDSVFHFPGISESPRHVQGHRRLGECFLFVQIYRVPLKFCQHKNCTFLIYSLRGFTKPEQCNFSFPLPQRSQASIFPSTVLASDSIQRPLQCPVDLL